MINQNQYAEIKQTIIRLKNVMITKIIEFIKYLVINGII